MTIDTNQMINSTLMTYFQWLSRELISTQKKEISLQDLRRFSEK
jgi:hypothetical protein